MIYRQAYSACLFEIDEQNSLLAHRKESRFFKIGVDRIEDHYVWGYRNGRSKCIEGSIIGS